MVGADTEDDEPRNDEDELAGAGLQQLRRQSRVLFTARLAAAAGEPERGVREAEVDDTDAGGLEPVERLVLHVGVGLLRLGCLAEGGLGEPPQAHHHEDDDGDPQRDLPAGLFAQLRHRTGLRGLLLAATERDPDREVADEQVHDATADVAGTCELLEHTVLRHALGG